MADALGVRQPTVYAYVSRGVLSRTTTVTAQGQRISLFDRDEVLALATQRARPRAGVIGTLIESDVTELEPRGRLAFRGHDVAELAEIPFEEAAGIVWEQPWSVHEPIPAALTKAAEAGLAAGVADPPERIVLALVHAATADEHRDDLGRDHVLTVGQTAIRLGVRALAGDPSATERTPIAESLWHGFTGSTPSPPERAAIEAALVVLMDHELAAATLAVRVAASTRADPWSCLLAGLAALRGPLHGGASTTSTRMLRRWLDGRILEGPIGAGFGHKVYEAGDPRTDILLDRVAALDPALVDEVEALAIEVAVRHSVLPNVDLGLAALAIAGGWPAGATECLFMISRMVGFTAHLLEEYPHGLRYRPRAVSAGG